MTTPILKEIQIQDDGLYVDAKCKQRRGYTVKPVWEGVDRPTSCGYGFSDAKLAQRFAAAYKAGVLYLKPPVIKTDVNGQTYVCADINILCRIANAELKRKGF